MKFTIFVSLLISSFAFASTEDNSKTYFIKKMLCSGTQAAANPVHDNWAFIGAKFIQFRSEKSQKNGGGFAWSLGTGTCFEDSLDEIQTLLETKNRCGSSVWYSGLLRQKQVDGKTVVFHPDRDDLEVVVTDSYEDLETGAQMQTLEGKFWYWATQKSSPEGGFDIKCTAELY